MLHLFTVREWNNTGSVTSGLHSSISVTNLKVAIMKNKAEDIYMTSGEKSFYTARVL